LAFKANANPVFAQLAGARVKLVDPKVLDAGSGFTRGHLYTPY
jgi:hypothetical protein